ncbi:MAG: hypothetical protein HC905_29265 [Bacteroidales bacterium]|nr:hypothetical protein [Bacteroidales bacterium]
MNLVSEMVTTQARLSLYAEQDGRPELLNIAEMFKNCRVSLGITHSASY